MSGSEG
jgi:hypothetical protein